MQIQRTLASALAVLAGLSSADVFAQTQFADPVEVMAGEKALGENRLYPSPAFFDMNADGIPDAFVGDLRGRITYALRQKDGSFAPEVPLKDAAGKTIDFENW